jgi:hypothetical protein
MLVVELKFKVQEPGNDEAQLDGITSVIAALVRKGNLQKGYSLGRDSEGWAAYGLAPARDAFKKVHMSNFARERVDGFGDVGLKHPRFRFVGKVPESAPACMCGNLRDIFSSLLFWPSNLP